jgi:SAM-dependent methyltransferase
MGEPPLYDSLGVGYGRTRRPDPRIARAIEDALGDARSIINVGAGIGAYEPTDREVTAVEPSEVMRCQRPDSPARIVDAQAEELPFPDASFDASMAVLTDHHWKDRARGLRELRRVARRRTLLFTFDQAFTDHAWIVRDYLPEFATLPGMSLDEIARHLGATEVRSVPIPWDCVDGFFHAFWRRPEAYLDPVVRAGISVFHRLSTTAVERFVTHLRDDLASGQWAARNASILERDTLDLGYRLLVGEREVHQHPT